MKIFLGGVNGVGKTTVLGHLQSIAPNTAITYGSRRYMEFLGLPPDSYDALRTIPETKHQVFLRKFVTSELHKTHDNELYVFDGHFVVFDQGESPIIKISDWITAFDLMVLIEAEPQNIYQRIHEDHRSGTRKRTYNLEMGEKATVAEIDRRMVYTRNVAQRVSEWFDVPLVIVPNITAIVTANDILLRAKGHYEKSL